MKAIRVRIAGRVQGVGFRAFVGRQAGLRGLAGWVRNRRDGAVEAVLLGEDDDVDAVVAACRDGPGPAEVIDVVVSDYVGPELTRFTLLPTE